MQSPESTTRRGLRWTAAILAFVAPIAVGRLLPGRGPTLCTFRNLTGYDCPGCGLTRSVIALLHGDVGGSLRAHPLGAIVFVLGLALWGTALYSWARRGRFVSWIGARTPTWAFAAFFAVYVAVYVMRLAGLLGGTVDPPGPGLLTALLR
jgi:uncharacterized protein DUF2752